MCYSDGGAEYRVVIKQNPGEVLNCVAAVLTDMVKRLEIKSKVRYALTIRGIKYMS